MRQYNTYGLYTGVYKVYFDSKVKPFIYTFGLLFEMSRVLKNAKDKNGYVYYDVN